MKKYSSIIALFIYCFSITQIVSAQQSPDWTVTDVDGVEHTLYEDYLDKDEIVVLKFFFVACPPCNRIAPDVQELYEEWGEGEEGVQFFEFTILGGDLDTDVRGYKDTHGLTFPAVSSEGGSLSAITPYSDGTFGTSIFTPSFAVIAPSGDVTYRVPGNGTTALNNISSIIEEIQASTQTQPSVFNLSITDAFGAQLSGVSAILTNASDQSITYPVDIDSGFSITELSSDYPGITDPVIMLEKTDDIRRNITPLDLLLIRKHILGIIPINDPKLLEAADTNGDGTITPLDMLVLQKVILGIFTEFPIDSYQFSPSMIPVSITPGESQDLQSVGIKTGDINGF